MQSFWVNAPLGLTATFEVFRLHYMLIYHPVGKKSIANLPLDVNLFYSSATNLMTQSRPARLAWYKAKSA